MRQAVELLEHAVRSRMPEYGHAFQPLLRPLDDCALRILGHTVRPRIPVDPRAREQYFAPYLEALPAKQKVLLDRTSAT